MSHTGQRAVLPAESLARIQAALRARGLAGWFLYDFRGLNPVAGAVLGLSEPLSRRYAAWLPAEGPPTVIAHAIELAPWSEFQGTVRSYHRWEEWERELGALVGKGKVALEYAPRGALPTVDRVPGGLVELLRAHGAELVGSGDLVTLFRARWSAADLENHRRAAAALARVARHAFEHAVAAGKRATEFSLKEWILDRLRGEGLCDADATVATGPNSADPHYEPVQDRHASIEPERVLLIDLWARMQPTTVFADQTWMGYTGPRPPADVLDAWRAVRDARDAALAFLRERIPKGPRPRGCDVDRAARGLIEEHGYGDAFVHRTGHSIDRELHGSGPNLDSLETEDTRTLEPEIGFSVEPGVYLRGRFGIRSEVNVALTRDGVEVNPPSPQTEIWTT